MGVTLGGCSFQSLPHLPRATAADGSHTTEFLRENFLSPQAAASPKAMPLPGTGHIHLPGYKNYLCVGLGWLSARELAEY